MRVPARRAARQRAAARGQRRGDPRRARVQGAAWSAWRRTRTVAVGDYSVGRAHPRVGVAAWPKRSRVRLPDVKAPGGPSWASEISWRCARATPPPHPPRLPAAPDHPAPAGRGRVVSTGQGSRSAGLAAALASRWRGPRSSPSTSSTSAGCSASASARQHLGSSTRRTPELARAHRLACVAAVEIRHTGNAGAQFDPIEDVDAAEIADLARLMRQLPTGGSVGAHASGGRARPVRADAERPSRPAGASSSCRAVTS
jgi:hypothetical protein